MNALTHECTATLAATPERVFQALTDEAQLTRWFAEHVEVALQPGGEFRFWGKHTYGAPARAQSSQKVLRVEAPRLLAFSWRLEDRDSEVTFQLAPEVGKSDSIVLEVKHHFPEAPAVGRALELIDDLWRMHFANLRAHLEGSAVCLPDFADPSSRLFYTILRNPPRHKVFEALLEP